MCKSTHIILFFEINMLTNTIAFDSISISTQYKHKGMLVNVNKFLSLYIKNGTSLQIYIQ